jgi:penicillin-binding protein 1A
VAAYGGRQALATDFNRATQARRQAGSSIKPLVYAMAFDRRDPAGLRVWSAHSTIANHRHTFKNTNGWTPRNVAGKYSPTSALAMGLAWSQNVATASLLEANGGPVPFKRFAARLGFETGHWRDELGLSLGTGEVTPLEQARFVATVIADGRMASGRPVVGAVDRVGQVRVARELSRPQVMEADDAALTRGIMRLVITYGTGGASRGAAGKAGYMGPAIGKTGTTDSEKDLWFVGGTPHYAMALWLGYDQPKRIGASSSDLAAPLWGWWARAVHEGLPADAFGGVQTKGRGVCTETGQYGNGSCRLIGAPFLEGEKPRGRCAIEHPLPDLEAPKYEGLWKRKAREAEELEAKESSEG